MVKSMNFGPPRTEAAQRNQGMIDSVVSQFPPVGDVTTDNGYGILPPRIMVFSPLDFAALARRFCETPEMVDTEPANEKFPQKERFYVRKVELFHYVR